MANPLHALANLAERPVKWTWNTTNQVAGNAPMAAGNYANSGPVLGTRGAVQAGYQMSGVPDAVRAIQNPSVKNLALAAMAMPGASPMLFLPGPRSIGKEATMWRRLNNMADASQLILHSGDRTTVAHFNRALLDRAVPFDAKIAAGAKRKVFHVPAEMIGRRVDPRDVRQAFIQDPRTGNMYVTPGDVHHGELEHVVNQHVYGGQKQLYNQHEYYGPQQISRLNPNEGVAPAHLNFNANAGASIAGGDSRRATIARMNLLKTMRANGMMNYVQHTSNPKQMEGIRGVLARMEAKQGPMGAIRPPMPAKPTKNDLVKKLATQYPEFKFKPKG